jgi:hypothetical protein
VLDEAIQAVFLFVRWPWFNETHEGRIESSKEAGLKLFTFGADSFKQRLVSLILMRPARGILYKLLEL